MGKPKINNNNKKKMCGIQMKHKIAVKLKKKHKMKQNKMLNTQKLFIHF